jgi:site-specific DNA-adenine methylase
MFNNQTKEDKMSEQQKRLENLNRQLRINDVLSVLITQSTKLIELVNANQTEVNRLKKELDHLKEVA